MRFKEFLFLIENNQFEQKKQFFINQGNQEQIVNYYINKFAELRKNYPTTKAWNVDLPNFTIPKNKRTDINQYKTFEELEQIVDYVNGQVKPQNIKVEIDGTPIHKDNHIEVYYAPHKHACIKYGEGYSWCVSRSDSSNMYNRLRYNNPKQNEPSFYFVKNIEKTNKELANNSNGNWLDKYHMFVIQAIGKNQYIVSSASNDGDNQMSWEDIIRIEPNLKNLKHLFVNYPLSDKEREDYKKFSTKLTDEQFKKLSYEEKEKYIDFYIDMDNLLTDEQFKDLSDDLKNKYIGLGVVLSLSQFEMIKNNKKLVDWHYKQMKDYLGNEPNILLNKASEVNRKDLIEFAIKHGANNFNYAMNYAVFGGHINIVNLLIERGANNFNDTMSRAAESGHIEIVNLMIKHGADDFNSAMSRAAENGHIDIVKLMIEHGADEFNEAMFNAAAYGYIDIVNLMIEHGADEFNEAMHNAAAYGYIDIVKLMIEHGANDFNSAMFNAAAYGHIDIVKLMIEHGAYNFNYIMRVAARNGHIAIVKLMIEHGANNFNSAMSSADKNGHIDIVELLKQQKKIRS